MEWCPRDRREKEGLFEGCTGGLGFNEEAEELTGEKLDGDVEACCETAGQTHSLRMHLEGVEYEVGAV